MSNTLNCLVYRFVYFDGTYKDMGFDCKDGAEWFAHNEGDRLMWYGLKL